jgi:excisionase family DNA binding protein
MDEGLPDDHRSDLLGNTGHVAEESLNVARRDRLAVSVDEASRLLGISKWLGYELAAQGKLPAVRLGRRLVVPIAALERMLDIAG